MGRAMELTKYELSFDSGPNRIFRNTLSNNKSHKCLVLGIGNEVGIISEYCDNVIGINISPEYLQKIRGFNADLILADAQMLPIKDSCVDLIVCKSSLHHLTDLNHSVLEIKRVMIQGSYFFLYEPGLLNIIAFFWSKAFSNKYS